MKLNWTDAIGPFAAGMIGAMIFPNPWGMALAGCLLGISVTLSLVRIVLVEGGENG